MTSEADELCEPATRLAVEARWYLELDWSCQGRSGSIRIDDPGAPFGTAIEGVPHYWYGRNDVGAHAWSRTPDSPVGERTRTYRGGGPLPSSPGRPRSGVSISGNRLA
ncbi:hypothetical protein [Streptomyces sp. YS-3]|uniref:hypothetical protein n=1 Tax=Streptomyces sp. YS-3 TaxID=3381352 RepID=UPI0038627DC4